MDNRSHHGINDYAARLIKFKCQQFCWRLGLPRSEQEVIEHDLRAHVELRLARHNPDRGKMSTFVDRVSDRWLISLWRYRFADKRDPRREECSLNDPVLDCDGRVVQRHETTPEAARTHQRLHDLERDAANVRERLPSEQHKMIVDALGRGETKSAISRDLGISPIETERHIDEIRSIYGNAGLREYL